MDTLLRHDIHTVGCGGGSRTHYLLVMSQTRYPVLHATKLVRVVGFEPTALRSQSECSASLSYARFILVPQIGFEPTQRRV